MRTYFNLEKAYSLITERIKNINEVDTIRVICSAYPEQDADEAYIYYIDSFTDKPKELEKAIDGKYDEPYIKIEFKDNSFMGFPCYHNVKSSMTPDEFVKSLNQYYL